MSIDDFYMALLIAEPWRVEAACRGMGTELFFTRRGGSRGEQAKDVCKGCPVSADCTEHADSTGEEYGIWGGELRSPRRYAVNATADLQTIDGDGLTLGAQGSPQESADEAEVTERDEREHVRGVPGQVEGREPRQDAFAVG